jgi:hypothetical protein
LVWLLALWLVPVVVLAAGCAKAQARNAPDGPPLQVPEPPPRVIEPSDAPLASAPAVPDTPPTAAPALPAPARPPARRATEAEPREAVPPPAVPAQPPPPDPQRALRSAPSGQDAAAERTVRDTLARAGRDLNRVDYGKLSVEGRAQYEQSKRFSQQAEQALKDRNFVFASTLADKAATLAAELLGGR